MNSQREFDWFVRYRRGKSFRKAFKWSVIEIRYYYVYEVKNYCDCVRRTGVRFRADDTWNRSSFGGHCRRKSTSRTFAFWVKTFCSPRLIITITRATTVVISVTRHFVNARGKTESVRYKLFQLTQYRNPSYSERSRFDHSTRVVVHFVINGHLVYASLRSVKNYTAIKPIIDRTDVDFDRRKNRTPSTIYFYELIEINICLISVKMDGREQKTVAGSSKTNDG